MMRLLRSIYGCCFPFFLVLFLAFGGSPAVSAEIAISLPLSGDIGELGRKFRTGVKLATETLNLPHQQFIADDGCDSDLATLAANDIEARNPAIVIGMLCNEPAKIIAGRLAGSNVPILVTGARSVRLIKDRKREGWNLWRLSPGDDYPVNVAADAIANLWKETPYAIVDDGTIYGRSFTDILRGQMQERGLPPQFSDSFRAAQSTQAGLLRRLQRSGVTAVFIASATTEDLFTIAKNMADFDISLDLITTEALSILPFLEGASEIPEGVRIVMAPLPYAPNLDAVMVQEGITAERQIYEGFAAMQIASSVVGNEGSAAASKLLNQTFDTVLGKIRFFSDGTSDYNPYKLMTWDGNKLAEDPSVSGAPAN